MRYPLVMHRFYQTPAHASVWIDALSIIAKAALPDFAKNDAPITSLSKLSLPAKESLLRPSSLDGHDEAKCELFR
jgi:hypothetical protein